MDTVGIIIWISVLLLAGIVCVLISIRIITKLLKETWGRVLVGVAFAGVLALAGLMALKWQDAANDAQSFDHYIRYAMDLARMQRLRAEYQAAPATQRPKLEIRLLDACVEVKRDHHVLRFGPTEMGEWAWTMRDMEHLEEELRVATRQSDQLAFGMLERKSSAPVRRKAFVALLDRFDLRIARILDSHQPVDREQALRELGVYGDRLMDFGLADLYYRRYEYGEALRMLRSALGEDWASTGREGSWWRTCLPLTKDDHLRFGYLFYLAKQDDRALREYRLARGANRSTTDMNRTYASGDPAVPAEGGR